jgi:glycosyltransferase involved in cell wall biosynthesis
VVTPPRPRGVLLVANAAAPYSRGLRVARSLAAAGFDVEIAAVDDGKAPREERDGAVVTRRYTPEGPWARFAVERRRPRGAGPLGQLGRLADTLAKVLLWPVHVRGWWRALETDLPDADLYHAFGILTIPVALALARRSRRHGRRGAVVYDVIDVILESNNVERLPRPVLAWYRWRERRWVRRSDAVITVNAPIAEHLQAAWGLSRTPTVLLNCQPRWEPPVDRSDAIREAAGLPADRRVVLFLGRLGRERGLDEAAEAVLRVGDAALVMLGFGAWAERLRDRDADPRYTGHHVTLPPVHPDLVPLWTSSADVSIIAVPANSLNQRLSTPNKFWESLAAGTPVVVGRDLEVMRAIVEAEGVGAVADPADPADLARALASLLDAPASERAAMRQRCLQVTRERYNWETAVVPYIELVQGLVPPGA